MSSITSHQRVGRRSLIGATTVEAGIDWSADASEDLSALENRRAKSITLGFRGGYEGAFEALFGVESPGGTGEGHLRLEVEHAGIVRDLLTEALRIATEATTPTTSVHPAAETTEEA